MQNGTSCFRHAETISYDLYINRFAFRIRYSSRKYTTDWEGRYTDTGENNDPVRFEKIKIADTEILQNGLTTQSEEGSDIENMEREGYLFENF